MIKVFISSTSKDLEEYRKAAIDTCIKLDLFPIAMEYFESMGVGATEGSKRKLDEADLYVGLYAFRYGYVEDGNDKSVTEIEFDYAGERGLDRLCFVADPNQQWPPSAIDPENRDKLEGFKERVGKLVRSTFTTVDNFAAELMHALIKWKEQNPGRNERQAELYTLLAELKDARSRYIRFSRGERRNDADEHERIISAAQSVCTRASRYDYKSCPVEGLKMVIPPYASEQEFARFKAINSECRDRLRYIADIWLTVNQVRKSDNFMEWRLWEEYEERNMDALGHGVERIEALINRPAV